MRLITSKATLWTQMIHCNAVLKNPEQSLEFNSIQHPIVLQLGGSDPLKLFQASKFARQFGYDEVNLNVGCPSARVQQGSFGACLMKEKELVGRCMRSIKQGVGSQIKVTVKCRLGVDEYDSYDFIKDFIKQVSSVGLVNHFVIHARKAYLKGLSPKQNRNVPSLKYQMVYQLIEDFPDIAFTMNGGIKTVSEAHNLLMQNPKLEGCMIGRTAYQNPYQLVKVDKVIYGDNKIIPSRFQIISQYATYVRSVEKNCSNGGILLKPILHLFNGLPNGVKYRQILTSNETHNQLPSQIIRKANEYMFQRLDKINIQVAEKTANESSRKQ